jgi:hypothetical protein
LLLLLLDLHVLHLQLLRLLLLVVPLLRGKRRNARTTQVAAVGCLR